MYFRFHIVFGGEESLFFNVYYLPSYLPATRSPSPDYGRWSKAQPT